MIDMPAPRVSVIVVTYNHGEWLRECLQSIVTQATCFPFEVIVGDDCSTDGATADILREFAAAYPDLIVPVLREKNVGITENWFDLVRRTRGEYIAHIDGDDRMLPGKLQKQADFLDAHPACSIVAHDLRVFDGATGKTISERASAHIPSIADIHYLVRNRTYFGHSSKMFRRSAMLSWQRNRPTVDFFLHIEHASKGNIGYLDEVLGEHRKSVGTASDIRQANYSEIISGYHDAFDRALELGVDPDLVWRGRLHFNYSIACDYLRVHDQANFKKYISLDADNHRYANWKHRLFNGLKFSPRIVQLIIKMNECFFRRIWYRPN